MNDITSDIHHIPTASGVLHAQVWTNDLAQGAPLVLLHDSLGCVALWRDFPQRLALATGRTVVAYDRLGYGLSAPHPGPQALSFVQDEAQQGLAAVLDYLGLNEFALLGHSVGGGMAVCAAAMHAQRCQSLSTLSAQSFVEAHTQAGIRVAAQQFSQPQAMQRLAKYHGDKAPWVLETWVQAWLSEPFAQWSLAPFLSQVRCPTLIIHGEQDEYGTLAHPQMLAQGMGSAVQLEILPDCGHFPHREHTAHCVALIQAHLAGMSA